MRRSQGSRRPGQGPSPPVGPHSECRQPSTPGRLPRQVGDNDDCALDGSAAPAAARLCPARNLAAVDETSAPAPTSRLRGSIGSPTDRFFAWCGRRRWAIGASLAVTVACLLQDPGRIAPDTKLDLAVHPLRFLGRALHMWEPSAAFGHVQNQSAGYLFPMGPFFALGHAIALPMWIVQRLWIALALIMALWGALKMAEALDVGSPTTRLIGALAYALSPAMTSLLGYETGGQLPVALLPWIVVPLIGGAVAGSTRLAAARSGIAVAAMGA